jgi:YHS domain-containing protein
VSGDVFRVGKDTGFATYNGRVYAFCCPDCKPDFDKDPAKFADKR